VPLQRTDDVRAIVHLDLDAFFAAVEIKERDDLDKQTPVVVGGQPESRGVVATASYAARRYGVHSAMPMAEALRRCPDAVIVPPRFTLYRDYSRQVMQLVRKASPTVEQVSIDEAYLDLSGLVDVWDEAIEHAGRLQSQIREHVGLSSSLGVASNKLVAKIASDHDKPGGLTVVRPGEEQAFLAPLPVRVLRGVGPVTAGKLDVIGVHTVAGLLEAKREDLWSRLGNQAALLLKQAKGIDERPLVTERQRRSISQERTFARDLVRETELAAELRRLSHRLTGQLRAHKLAAATIVLKLRYADFATLTRQTTLVIPTDSEQQIGDTALRLLWETWQPGRPVRLLGVAARNLERPSGQMTFLAEP
jgi:DNA polymerase-4